MQYQDQGIGGWRVCRHPYQGGDPSTTLTMGGKELGPEGEVSLLVEDADREDEAALIVVVGPDGTVLAQVSTIVGGS